MLVGRRGPRPGRRCPPGQTKHTGQMHWSNTLLVKHTTGQTQVMLAAGQTHSELLKLLCRCWLSNWSNARLHAGHILGRHAGQRHWSKTLVKDTTGQAHWSKTLVKHATGQTKTHWSNALVKRSGQPLVMPVGRREAPSPWRSFPACGQTHWSNTLVKHTTGQTHWSKTLIVSRL
jgi:hypothetical protein